MQRTFNYTGRARIDRSEVQIRLDNVDGEVPLIDADFNFRERGLPKDSKIYVEAYHRNTLKRFDFGTLDSMVKPADRRLDGIDHSGPTLFRVRVVDESEEIGKVLASAEKLRAHGEDDDENRTSLLTLRTRPLAQQTWKLEFETGGKPELVINSNVPGAIERLRSDVLFKTLILPAALREILMFYIWSESDDDDPVVEQWMMFAETIAMKRPAEKTYDVQLEWIEDVVDRFSERFELCDQLVSEMEATS